MMAMDLAGWEARYQSRASVNEDSEGTPTPLLEEFVPGWPSGKALDLACGAGRNAVYLAQNGWNVTALDGSQTALLLAQARATKANLHITTECADLQGRNFTMEPNSWNLITFLFYGQRDLFAAIKASVRQGGHAIGIVHITQNADEPTEHRLRPGELHAAFADWKILHSYEGASRDKAHKQPVAEIVAQRR